MGQRIGTYKLLVRKPEEKRPFLRPRRRVGIILNGPSVGRIGRTWNGFIWHR
jgi:hypothetical protein